MSFQNAGNLKPEVKKVSEPNFIHLSFAFAGLAMIGLYFVIVYIEKNKKDEMKEWQAQGCYVYTDYVHLGKGGRDGIDPVTKMTLNGGAQFFIGQRLITPTKTC